jgi:hypothetical protein
VTVFQHIQLLFYQYVWLADRQAYPVCSSVNNRIAHIVNDKIGTKIDITAPLMYSILEERIYVEGSQITILRKHLLNEITLHQVTFPVETNIRTYIWTQSLTSLGVECINLISTNTDIA